MMSPSEPTSKYEGSLNRHYNHRMQILFPSPAARPESPPPVQFQGPVESDSRRSSFNDAEPSRVLRDVRREEEVEFEIRCRIHRLERCQTSGDDHGKEWED